ncbi:MAG: response regulator [Gammaproteobacteria bacterium]|nr:response regulator [Gammaproteobacteria bacterium]
MTNILLADDDTVLAELLKDYLSAEGFTVTYAEDGQRASDFASEQDFDLIVLDVMMPKKNGFDTLREIRLHQNTPVLMLTARGDDVDRIVGLEMGADDYLPKPCNPRELVARIRAILRRTSQLPNGNSLLKVGAVELSRADRTVTLDHQPVELTSTEFNILDVLMEEAGQVVEKNDLSLKALGRKLTAYDRSLDMHISNLRKKLGRGEDGGEPIKTVRGVGYMFTMPARRP